MYHQVQQFREDQHSKKLQEVDQKAKMRNEILAQMEDKKRQKETEKLAEKNKDAALQREYDQMMQDRDNKRV
jgi:hypothetical protein